MAANEQSANVPLRMIGHFSHESNLASGLHGDRNALLEKDAIPCNRWHQFATRDDAR